MEGAEGVKVLLLAYGSTRILSYEDDTDLDTDFTLKIENLFDPYASLNTVKKFYGKISKNEFDEVASLLSKLLGLENGYEFIRKNNDVFLKRSDEKELQLKNLSDGFQSMIALATDIIIIMKQYWSKIEEAEGIVLIDELDLHLHPQWKLKIITNLRESFPRIQFISTTHDPLCLRGLENSEINVVKKTNEEVYLVKNLPNIEGMQIDQILMANYFGLHSTYSTYYNTLFDKYYQLLNKPEKTQEEKEEIVNISRTINKATVLGNTRREQILFSVIDSHIADIITAIESIKDASSRKQLERHKKSYNRHYNSLRKRMCSKSPYAAVARNIIHEGKLLKKLKKEFKKVLREANERIDTLIII